MDDLVERLRQGVLPCGLHGDNETELFDIEDANERMAEAADTLAAKDAEIVRLKALLEEAGEAMKGPNDWLDRWAAHVGSCVGGSFCTCGLTMARYELETMLAKLEADNG